MAAMRWGEPELRLLGLLGSGRKAHGYALAEETGLITSTVYDVLKRFETAGLVIREKERVDPHLSTRVPRVIYKGTTVANDELAKIRCLVGCTVPA